MGGKSLFPTEQFVVPMTYSGGSTGNTFHNIYQYHRYTVYGTGKIFFGKMQNNSPKRRAAGIRTAT
jgi:hypothetical protein